ncbi:beta-galactosidase [Staphylococcus pettenkoferi]|uniref:Beta-galactosidase n=4 Tax=Staphylococcus pettenkoferi TaxID=170573 RepID=A0ABT4BNJ4_9STAP|nr:beta-galactosidase family protein [Staphylococcus pettenkoferi]MCY1565364.1 beta-galactosidase [Staphylococcus pettenkoferi]MCY1570558.1 beta-galactosidase [Staphylococcus pettenkoferi]MCY1584228.1 beta-galactosidase [Staphylococcus pettenkoferi]MCY1609030.1 beta-galactosidase [Staphylococcus pettenkoferi]MCY1623570.1 beta-galactosidase [Staphylococcus pettenkoferi]
MRRRSNNEMTSRFTVGETFYLDGEPFQIRSGAIHYFRIPRADWEHSLFNLKALGMNTVETYIPWNYHEMREGEFDFQGEKDVAAFIQLAESLGLYVIVRPSPYICAEWDFGGLPAWLLNERHIRLRSSDEKFIEKVASYYHELFKILTPLQIDEHGPIIMMQIENEYGSFGEDKTYLRQIMQLMRDNGVTVPLFTSDGAWSQCLEAGSVDDSEVVVTGNFGSRTEEHFTNLKNFQQKHGLTQPLMCTEFWDGWFNRWGDPIIQRESDDLVEEVRYSLTHGHLNLYMFQGGTNYAFWNGCSARGTRDLPQVTSYDYDAPLDESGEPREKYFALQACLKELVPDVEQHEPRHRAYMSISDISVQSRVSLFEIVDDIATVTTSKYPQPMEALGDGYGYALYRTTLKSDNDTEALRLVEARDRAHIYHDQQLVQTTCYDEVSDKFDVMYQSETAQVDILVENLGRVNYGYKLLAPTQRKGLNQGLMQDLHFIQDYQQYALDFEKVPNIDWNKRDITGTPTFHRFEFTVEEPKDTYIDLSAFGKGVVLVNGVNIGRYWQVGPTLSLYISQAWLHEGPNEIIIFETEGQYAETITLREKPVFKEMEDAASEE